MGVLKRKGDALVYKMFLAPSYISRDLADEIASRAEKRLYVVATRHGLNAFIKGVVRRGDEYRAVVVVESLDEKKVTRVIDEVESRTVRMALKIIQLLKQELKHF